MSARATLTVTSGSTVTSAWGNAMRDHVVGATTADDVSLNGQMAVNTSNDRVVARLGAGNFYVAGRLPRVRLKRTGGVYSLGSTGVNHAIAWNAEDYDTDSMWSSGAGVTVSHTGNWLVSYSLYLQASATTFAAWIEVGGVRYASTALNAYAASPNLSSAVPISLTAGDVVTLYAYCWDSTLATITTGASTDYLQLNYMGPS